MKIITIDKNEQVLRSKSKKVNLEKDYIKPIVEKMQKYMVNNPNAFGISAVQLGYLYQIICIKDKLLINPKILKEKGLGGYWEGCLSIPNKLGYVERPYILTIEYSDIDGTVYKEIFEGFDAQVLSHEIDHLNGMLFIDKAVDIKDVTPSQKQKIREQYPYKILSK